MDEKMEEIVEDKVAHEPESQNKPEENTEEIVQLRLKGHSSIKDLIKKGIKASGSFCSFEAGLLAGVVEKLSDLHCFAQEVGCALQTGESFCDFMIVFQKSE